MPVYIQLVFGLFACRCLPLNLSSLESHRNMTMNKDAVVTVLNEILELELAGVIRYTHYSLS